MQLCVLEEGVTAVVEPEEKWHQFWKRFISLLSRNFWAFILADLYCLSTGQHGRCTLIWNHCHKMLKSSRHLLYYAKVFSLCALLLQRLCCCSRTEFSWLSQERTAPIYCQISVECSSKKMVAIKVILPFRGWKLFVPSINWNWKCMGLSDLLPVLQGFGVIWKYACLFG